MLCEGILEPLSLLLASELGEWDCWWAKLWHSDQAVNDIVGPASEPEGWQDAWQDAVRDETRVPLHI